MWKKQRNPQLRILPLTQIWLKVCTVEIVVRELEKSAIKIEPSRIIMEGDTLLTQYYVPQWSLKYVNESKFEQIFLYLNYG